MARPLDDNTKQNIAACLGRPLTDEELADAGTLVGLSKAQRDVVLVMRKKQLVLTAMYLLGVVSDSFVEIQRFINRMY